MAYEIHPTIVKLTFPIAIFGIIGNSLVITSILRRRSLLTSNYYFALLHLAICDNLWLVVYFVNFTTKLFKRHVAYDETFCLFAKTGYFFAVAGSFMMLTITILRYRATAYPFKPPVSKRKLKIICATVYIVSFILGYVLFVPNCVENDDHFVIVKIQHYIMMLG